LFWRFLTAALWMLLAVCFLRRGRKRKPDRAQVMLMLELATVGAISYAGGSCFFYLSSLRIGTGPAMVIFFSFPVFVTLFSVLFKQSKMNRYLVTALAMVMGGLVLLNGTGSHNLDNIGIGLALIASFSYAIYVYYSKRSSTKVDSLWLTLFICMGCSLIFLSFALAAHSFHIPPTVRAWRDILILGILATAIPIQLLLNGLKYISSVKASILSVLEAVTTVVVGVMFLEETLSGMQVIGILIVLSGAIVIQFEKQPEFKIRAPLK
jgi:drug/metabolite transporter (DMT)-like permease